ncbi:UDP-N-acetylmuramoyl-L-alanyl-D-glutamate--2,6-diaminopimelate ligase [Zhihengliuella salsuginis]|uniref:UDP-N-acetylmuramyl-tripeptide synthetase n=1 Tax=Zhihengliuella salsuginis TaxID=578222 RepID=A0ABQ3GC51_9MICC|nr:UDP-N-acetylmuramoyl-L-alanyl-D-glutamate--2,6-diaminopimelate ligase [Zhihengliuella salsuginis]GHD00942.1 UDP-N-acetylmuramoyl-L-alanyl-D-glutamate--2,6-diaminopimelate ligase [Zhihengliuella salsuginis]
MGLNHQEAEREFRPARHDRVQLEEISAAVDEIDYAGPAAAVTGVCLDSRAVQPGDLYVALPGARVHGARFAAAAAAAGAAAILTDDEGASLAAGSGLPVLSTTAVRSVIGRVASLVYGTRADAPALFGVTGTNGKTTTTYFLRSLLRALGHETGLIGTIEIVAGATPVPSVLTTPEAPQLHALMARMREGGITAAAMEVSSHSLDYQRVAGLAFQVSGFTNLTQDHLDLHGTMEDYFASKAGLFAAETSRSAVVTVDDEWGTRLAAERRASGAATLTLATAAGAAPDADWVVSSIRPHGLGHAFELHGPRGAVLQVSTGLPGLFNVSNAALAVVMIVASGADLGTLQQTLSTLDPLTVEVPGRMQVIGTRPAAVVDFAHNADALERAIDAVRPADTGGRVIVVFGATGDRDATKRPVMGAVAARHADVVVVTDDDPHGEDAAGIRAAVLEGARAAVRAENLAADVVESAPRARAIEHAVQLARPQDTVLIAGRGHETIQEVQGVDHALDDRVELRRALLAAGHSVLGGAPIEGSTTRDEFRGPDPEGVKSS